MQCKILFARFPFGNQEAPSVANWLIPTVIKAKADPRISFVDHIEVDDTPITMSRNRVLKHALAKGFDYVVMIDSDMKPDLPVLGAKPFWPGAFDFAWQHNGPCCVGAPYCGPPPHENIYVFRWGKRQTDHPNRDMALDQYSREEAALRGGFEEVGALPTGLILIAMDGVKRLDPPWFDYDYADKPFNTQKATTEDVFFTRNLNLVGVPQYVFWDAWAGHWKRKCVGKPDLLSVDAVRADFRDAVIRNNPVNQRLVDIDCGINKARQPNSNGIQAQVAH